MSPVVGAKAIAKRLGRSERWLHYQLRGRTSLSRYVRQEGNGQLVTTDEELAQYLEQLPRVDESGAR